LRFGFSDGAAVSPSVAAPEGVGGVGFSGVSAAAAAVASAALAVTSVVLSLLFRPNKRRRRESSVRFLRSSSVAAIATRASVSIRWKSSSRAMALIRSSIASMAVRSTSTVGVLECATSPGSLAETLAEVLDEGVSE
jgi:hypothetical protein